jgi:hypothetical protein
MLALNPWVILGATLAIATALGGAYVKGRGDGKAVIIAQQSRDDHVRMETLQLAQLAAAEEIAKIEVKHVTVRQKLETQILERPVYRDCIADDSVFELTNEAITGQAPAARGELPGSSADDGKILW